MNCKLGDMAIVVKSLNAEGNIHIGKVLTCVALLPVGFPIYELNGRPGYLTQPEWDTDLIDPYDGQSWIFADCELTPLRGNLFQNETEKELEFVK
jgi:hypothetical protein